MGSGVAPTPTAASSTTLKVDFLSEEYGRDPSLNPSVTLDQLLEIKKENKLYIHPTLAKNAGNSAVYKFYYLSPPYFRMSSNNLLAEWHVHWNKDGTVGNPRWKKGEKDKYPVPTDEAQHKILREILGVRWEATKKEVVVLKKPY